MTDFEKKRLFQVLFGQQLSKNLISANLSSNIVLFSVVFERTLDFEDCLFNKSYKFTHVERVVPELRMITVLRVKLLKKRGKVQSHKNIRDRRIRFALVHLPRFSQRPCPGFPKLRTKLP